MVNAQEYTFLRNLRLVVGTCRSAEDDEAVRLVSDLLSACNMPATDLQVYERNEGEHPKLHASAQWYSGIDVIRDVVDLERRARGLA